jgi:hypothetical protein
MYVPFLGMQRVHEALYTPSLHEKCVYMTILKGSHLQVCSKGKNEMLTPFFFSKNSRW